MSLNDITILNDSNWENIIEKGEIPAVVMFSSPTCPYCRQMEPYYAEFAEEFKDKIIFGKLDISESHTTASRYGVMGTPTFKFFCKGKPIQELVGAVYPSIIKKTVEEALVNGEKCVSSTTWIPPGITGYG